MRHNATQGGLEPTCRTPLVLTEQGGQRFRPRLQPRQEEPWAPPRGGDPRVRPLGEEPRAEAEPGGARPREACFRARVPLRAHRRRSPLGKTRPTTPWRRRFHRRTSRLLGWACPGSLVDRAQGSPARARRRPRRHRARLGCRHLACSGRFPHLGAGAFRLRPGDWLGCRPPRAVRLWASRCRWARRDPPCWTEAWERRP